MAVIIFEHQSRDLKEIPRKLHKYISSIWDAERKADAKVLSAPYFIVLRTGKKPHRGNYPTMGALVPKGPDGKPFGHVPEVKYKVVDLPAWNFKNLVGGPVLRLVLGMLHKMTGGHEDEFPEALLPLLEIVNDDERMELTKELIDFAAKAFAAHNRRLDAEAVSKAIFKDKEQKMIETIFEEREAIGEVRGEARGKVLTILETRFSRVSQNIEKTVRSMTDPIALESLVEHAKSCKSLAEFAEAIR